jgi:molybdenum cofactor synthesis domain-containing protein
MPLIAGEPSTERVPLEFVYGRISSNDVLASANIPPMASSHMDGFAVRYSDIEGETGRNGRAKFVLDGEIRLGVRPPRRLGDRRAVRVSTGSLLPAGADTVVPLEMATVESESITITAPVQQGQFVFGAGEDVKKGGVMIPRGRPIRTQDIGLAVALGIERLAVFRKPRLAILATGSELTDAAKSTDGKVRNSHVPIFARLAELCGCSVLNLGIAPDAPREILAKVQRGLKEADLVLTTGGTSIGKLDLAGDVVGSLKPDVMFHGIRMDRGRVAGVAVVRSKPILMMPGPIQGAMNVFVLFALPVIRKLSGSSASELVVQARLTGNWEARRRFPNFTKVLYTKLTLSRAGLLAEPLMAETESMTILTKSDAFVIVPEEKTRMAAGEIVEALLLPGYSFS